MLVKLGCALEALSQQLLPGVFVTLHYVSPFDPGSRFRPDSARAFDHILPPLGADVVRTLLKYIDDAGVIVHKVVQAKVVRQPYLS